MWSVQRDKTFSTWSRSGEPGQPLQRLDRPAPGVGFQAELVRRRNVPSVLLLLVMAITFLGQACDGEAKQDLAADVTQIQNQPETRPKPPRLSTGGVADYTLSGPAFGEVRQAAVFQVTMRDAVHPSGNVRFKPSASNGDGTFSPASLDFSDTARSGSFSYTPTRSGARAIAIANNGGLTDPAPVPFISKVHAGTSYYIAPNSTSGSGTYSNPYGLPDLHKPDGAQGPALAILRPGDTLNFLAGTYHFTGTTTDAALLSPTVSGTASHPITLQAHPGAVVNVVEDSGGQSIFGTGGVGPFLNYVRFLGFSIDTGPRGSAFHIYGTGNEVGYCTIIGHYIATVDNHAGIRIDSANSIWIHNNNIYGVKGNSANSSAIEIYTSAQLIVEDNYIYGCTVGIHDKQATSPNGSLQNTYRRNYVTNCPDGVFLGNNQGPQAFYYIYDNVFDGKDRLGDLNSSSQIHNNLVRGTTEPFSGGDKVWKLEFWNNIVLAGARPITGYRDNNTPFVRSGPQGPLAYMDYNVYDGATTYDFGNYTPHHAILDLLQMRRQGFEQHSRVVRGASVVFQDLTTYGLRPQWRTAGRDGDRVGPRFPIAGILDTGRYGPRGLRTDSRPLINQQPQSQETLVGGRATFTVQVNGSGPLYQWLRSNDGGKTWITLQGANFPVFTIPQVSTTDAGAIVRCLVSSVGGSVWSDPATLTVSPAAVGFWDQDAAAESDGDGVIRSIPSGAGRSVAISQGGA